MPVIRLLTLVLGWSAGLVALLFAGIAGLGYLGILADVGDQENRRIGRQALWIALGAGALGVVMLLIASLLKRGARETTGPHAHPHGPETATPLPYAGYAPTPSKPPAPARTD